VLVQNLVARDLNLGALGDISQTSNSTMEISGRTVLSAGTANIALNNNNTFNTLEILSAVDVSLVNTTATVLDDVIAESFSLESGGAVTDIGDIVTSGLTSFVASGATDARQPRQYFRTAGT
jgi:hypothetical protein